jgi:chromosome partitioning protein
MHMVNPRLRVSGCLVTMWTPAAAPRETELRGMNPRMLPIYRQTIRRSDKVDGMTYSGDPLTIYSPRSAAGVDYRRWVREYLTKEVQ